MDGRRIRWVVRDADDAAPQTGPIERRQDSHPGAASAVARSVADIGETARSLRRVTATALAIAVPSSSGPRFARERFRFDQRKVPIFLASPAVVVSSRLRAFTIATRPFFGVSL